MKAKQAARRQTKKPKTPKRIPKSGAGRAGTGRSRRDGMNTHVTINTAKASKVTRGVPLPNPSAGPDAKLFRLVAKYADVYPRWKQAADRQDELESESAKLREDDDALHDNRVARDAANALQEELLTKVNKAYARVMACRAHTLAGMQAKVRAYQEWHAEDGFGFLEDATEILTCLATDIDAMMQSTPALSTPREEPIYAAMRAHAEAERAYKACFDEDDDSDPSEAEQALIDEKAEAASLAAWAMFDVEIGSQRAFDDFMAYVVDNYDDLKLLYEPLERVEPQIRQIIANGAHHNVWEEGAMRFIVETMRRLRTSYIGHEKDAPASPRVIRSFATTHYGQVALNQLSVTDLVVLWYAQDLLFEVVGGVMNQPRVSSVAQDIITNWTEEAAHIRDDIATELTTRTPEPGSQDADDLAETLVRHAVNGFFVEEYPELAAVCLSTIKKDLAQTEKQRYAKATA